MSDLRPASGELGPGVTAGRARRWWWVLAVVLLLIATGLLVSAQRGQQDPAGSPELASLRASESAAPSGAADPARAVPVALRIPTIGVDEPLIMLGLNPDETVEVPTDFQKPGWYKLGPAPGQTGSAVILGHVDSYQGPAVFYRLRSLKAGDQVEVSLSDGGTAHFAVTKVETYPKTQFPAEDVYGSHGSSALQLVTCGGEFDSQTRSYRSNVVAYTSLIATTRPTTEVHRGGR